MIISSMKSLKTLIIIAMHIRKKKKMNERYWIEHEEREKIKREEELDKLIRRQLMLIAIVLSFVFWVWKRLFELLI